MPEIATGFLSAKFPPPLNKKTHPWDLVIFQTALYILHIRIEADLIEKSADNAILIFDRSLTDIDAYLPGAPDKELPQRASEIFGIDYRSALDRFAKILVFRTPKDASQTPDITAGNDHRFHDLAFAKELEGRILRQIFGVGFPDSRVVQVPFTPTPDQKINFLVKEFSKALESKP